MTWTPVRALVALAAGLFGVVLAYLFEIGAGFCLDDVVSAGCPEPRPSWWGVVLSAAAGSFLAASAFWVADRRRGAVSHFLRRRPLVVVLTAAALGGLLVSSVVDDAMRDAKVGCDLAIGGEAGAGTYLCPDGLYYAGSTLAAFFLSFLSVLVLGLVWTYRTRRHAGPVADEQHSEAISGHG